MGFFSWKTSDTKKSIPNIYSGKEPVPVYVLSPFGEKYNIYEDEYQGYGVFNGVDIYALVAKWNEPLSCIGDVEHDRLIGINLACSNEKNSKLKYPIKIVEKLVDYENALPSESCPYQGYFYED